MNRPREPFEPLRMLGCDEEELRTMMRGRRVTPGEIEATVATDYRWRAHLHDADSYWVTVSQAARILGESPRTVRRQLSTRRLPHLTQVTGVRLMERRRVEEIARHGGVHPVHH